MNEIKKARGNQYQFKPKSFPYGKPDQYGNRPWWCPPERLVYCSHCGLPWENIKKDKNGNLTFKNLKCPECNSMNITRVHAEDEEFYD